MSAASQQPRLRGDVVASREARFRLVGSAAWHRRDQQQRWQELADAAPIPNVFLAPSVLEPALRHLDDGRVRLAVVERDGAWQIMTPVRTRDHFWRHPVRTTTGWQHTQMFLGTPLVGPRATDDDWDLLLAALVEGPDAWWVLPDVDRHVATTIRRVAARRGLGCREVDSHARAVTRRRDDGDYAARALSSKKRKELRRQWRRLEEALGGGLEVVDLADAGPGPVLDAGVRRFLAMEAAGWKGDDGGAMAERPGEADFFAEACTALAARGELHLLALQGDAGTAAMLVVVRSGSTFSQWKIAYDEEQAAWSPGLHVLLASFASFHARGAGEAGILDSCAGADHPMARSTHLDERDLTTLFVGLGQRGTPLALATAPTWLDARRRRTRRLRDRRASSTGPSAREHAPNPSRPDTDTRNDQEPTMSLLDLDPASRDALRAAGETLQPHDVDHGLTSHELLTLDALADLAASLPEKSVEHNVGDLPDVVADGQAPRLDLPVDELIRTIPDNGAWAVIKNIEQDPRYSALLDECLDEIETLVSGPGRSLRREGFIFLSSPGSVTPTHIDPEFNVLLQVQGEKTMTTGTWQTADDRQREAERLRAGGHRNLDAPLATSHDHPLVPGKGVFVPPYTPHIVRNGSQPSISLSVTWSTKDLLDEALLHRVNSYVRRTGLSPAEPGRRARVDRAKLGAFRALQRAKRTVRG